MRKGFRKQLSLLIILAFLITIILPSLPIESAASQTTTKNLLTASSATEKIIANNLTSSLLGDAATFSVPKDAVGSSTNNLLEGSKLYALSEGMTEPEEQIPTANLISAGPVKPEITYGPYQSTDSNQAHAYDPFKKDAPSESGQQSAASFKKDQLLIKMLPNVVQKQTFTAQSVSIPFAGQGVLSLEPLLPETSGKMSALSVNAEAQESEGVWYKAKLQKDTDVVAAASAISSQAGVLAAEPDYIRSTMADGIPDAVTDDRIGEQWQLERSAIKQAWSYLKEQGINPGGSRDVIVAVIDTGVDYTHPDLIGNMWTNSGEIAGNGIDDDHNGYIDDIHGACIVGDRWNGESGDPMDDHGHGTHVAGIIVASAGNGGTAGVAFNVQIMAIKAAQSNGVLTSSDIAQAINYAVQHGADVINMSFGGYGRSTVEEDALQMAFGQAVLVAAAGNDGVGNEPSHLFEKPMFPAAYPWVLGVMAEGPYPAANGDNLAGFSNWDCIPQNSWEYEIMAPGVEILSTLPGGKYAAWGGTSMATPVVSGIAALVRSKYMDKESYSSRFIMGQIASTGDLKQGKTYDPYKPPLYYKEVNALKALTETPKPKLSYLEHYVFDKADIAEVNNGDGIIDAGETINLGIVIRNHWGKADPVQVKIDSIGSGGISDPYVSIKTDTVDYGAVGNFATDDNGFIYTNDVLTGLDHPFQFKVAANTPNDHIIPINITITGKNGFDPADNNDYTSQQQISLIVRNGVVLPGVISQDMTLTKDKYWIVPNATVIKEGATLTVEPGTQIQFWSSEPEDPYAEKPMAYIQVKGSFLVNGTAEAPVEMFASGLYPGYEVKIYSTDYLDTLGRNGYNKGYAKLNYARVMNPNLAVSQIDHCYFSQDLFDRMYKRYLDTGEVKTTGYNGPVIIANNICNSRFYQLGCNPSHSETTSRYELLQIRGTTSENLFDSCLLYMDQHQAHNNVFLKNYKLNGSQYGDRSYWVSKGMKFGYRQPRVGYSISPPVEYNGHTYTAISLSYKDTNELLYKDAFLLAESFANQLGGQITTINDQAENDFIKDFIKNYAVIGLNDFEQEGIYTWVDGEPLEYTNWDTDGPNSHGDENAQYNIVTVDKYRGLWREAHGSEVYFYPIILELPAGITQEGLDNVEMTTVTNNAILNRWWDPDVSHWMRFTASEGEQYKCFLSYNYWGTNSETLIEKAIIHYNDFKNLEEIVYQPILTEAPVSAYPFVTDVYVSTETEERASKVGAEKIQVHVLFNRDMDKNIQPQVSFGPDMPTTDYTVNAVEGGWISPRHWVGQFKISPLTGDGYQFFRVAGAVAADDPWLVTGNDSERFRFEIITSGTEAMNLQASGGEGKVSLSWTQDDFDVLAGYNLYRSTMLDETYTKINSTLIPADQKSYVDTDVQPGQPYYYKFQVVKTDFTVSDFSNVASGTPLDTIAPVIQHQSVLGTAPGLGLTLAADVTDNVRVSSVELYYRKTGTTSYSQKKMVNTTGNRYTATIEGANVQAPGIDYYIQASDGISIVRSGNANSPHQIVITNAPKITSISPLTGPQSGGTSVVITGTNFKNGASVTFDQEVASSVMVESVNRITAVTPAHFPAVVDVCVANNDGYKDTLLQAFTYKSEGIEASMPSVNADRGQTFELPISITNVEGLRSADISLSFDKDLLAVNSVRLGALTADFTLDSNQSNPGKLILALASGTSVNGSGNLAIIEFQVLEGSKTSSTLHLEDIKLNSGAITASANDATFMVANTHSISGNIYYYSNSLAVNKVDLSLKGLKTYTASSSGGSYSIFGIEKGDYSQTASKSDEATGISAYDAAIVLQASVASVNLSNQQKIAADVDKNGSIDSMDASYILEQVVGLRTLPFPGQGRVWAFEPIERTYSTLDNDLTNQNFTGILIGDVSGNWGSSGNGIQSLDAVGFSIEEVYSSADSIVSVPVKIDAGSGNIYAVDLVISYDQNMVTALEVKKSTATTDFVMQVNLTTPGKIRIAMASLQPLSGLAELLNIDFKIIANPGEETIIEIDQAAANEMLASAIQNGKVIIDTSEGCFIATAAYGSYLDPHVWKLRNFRDQVLLQHSWGRWFVRQYYHYSPPVADLIAASDELRLLVRILLTPLVMAVAFPWAVPILFILVLIVAIPRRLFLRQGIG